MAMLLIKPAVIALGLLATSIPASAGCRGFACKFFQGVPVVGPALEAGDAVIAEMKERGSREDVLNHATTFKTWQNPIGKPRSKAVVDEDERQAAINCVVSSTPHSACVASVLR